MTNLGADVERDAANKMTYVRRAEPDDDLIVLQF
jgi:hypothetical protein